MQAPFLSGTCLLLTFNGEHLGHRVCAQGMMVFQALEQISDGRTTMLKPLMSRAKPLKIKERNGESKIKISLMSKSLFTQSEHFRLIKEVQKVAFVSLSSF